MATKKPAAKKPAAKKPTSAAPSAQDSKLLDAWFSRPGDPTALRVLADHWAEQGDPRGEFVQLSLEASEGRPNPERLAALRKKHGGALVGPARPFLREWDFGPWGVVETARCEADRLVEGVGLVGELHPRLSLCLTSVKTRATMQALAKVDLRKLHFVGFTMGIIGSLGGSNLTEAALRAIAPAFRGVRRLALQARGDATQCFSPEALAAFADQHEGLEFFALDYYTNPGPDALPPLSAYLDVIASHRAFQSLTAVVIPEGDPAVLKRLPRLEHALVDSHALLEELPCTAQQWARFQPVRT